MALPVPPSHGCMGRWQGRGRNSNASTYWTIDLTLSAAPDGGRCGSIEYTNPACGGHLEGCRLVGEDIETREVYTHNDGHCAPAGRVIIRCEGEQMRYSWIGWERVDSVLHRVGGEGSPSGEGPSPPAPVLGDPQLPPAPLPAPSPGPSEGETRREERGLLDRITGGCGVARAGRRRGSLGALLLAFGALLCVRQVARRARGRAG